MRTVHLVIRGTVQGVGFRWFARSAAQRCGVGGWVRNREDGGVEIAVSGEDDSVHRFLAMVKRGPAGSRVDGIDYLPGDATTEQFGNTFAVRR